MISFIQKIPILTTVLSGVFFFVLFNHWNTRHRPMYLWWWMVGVLTYGLGTLTESIVALWGWSSFAFKSWYILGALLGGFPLAQGSVYLMFNRRAAHTTSLLVSSIVLIAAIAVVLSPINYELVEPARLTGRVLGWKEVRYITPVINIYAFVFLVGGALYSAYRYSREAIYRQRFVGNICIAIGGLLPGIGGSFTKFGYTEVLYVTELLGIIFIYLGYTVIKSDKTLSVFQAQQAIASGETLT